jgi:hypothetical protein
MSGKGGYFKKLSLGSETSDMTSEGLGEMFESDSTDTCVEKFPLMSMGGRAEGLACADPGARTPIGVSGKFLNISYLVLHCILNISYLVLHCILKSLKNLGPNNTLGDQVQLEHFHRSKMDFIQIHP